MVEIHDDVIPSMIVGQVENATLKKCPFCGGEAELYKYHFTRGFDLYSIICKECKYEFKTPEEAINAWNTRIKE